MKQTANISTVLEDFRLHLEARHVSKHTISDYFNTFRKLVAHVGDIPFWDITKEHIESFLAAQTVSKKTVLNYHIGLSALWTWAYNDGRTPANVMRQVTRPKPEKTKIVPFSDADIRALFAALARSRPYQNRGATTSNALPNPERNRALLMVMLDCGIRAEEVAQLTIADLDVRNLRLHISAAGAKGDKERYVPLSARTAEVVRKYLSTCRPDSRPPDPLFAVEKGYSIDRHALLKLVKSIGKRAGVSDCHPHRFRHTFAISYIRNGGDPWTLQEILGHSSMDTIKIYLRIAQNDMDAVHRRASPVANLRL